MHLDDIEDADAPKAEEYLRKFAPSAAAPMPIIQMLAQLENFQKKLWLKKKFVVETRYCFTLDRVPEALYPDICANDDSMARMGRRLGRASRTESAAGRQTFLKANPYLMVDTRHFHPRVHAQAAGDQLKTSTQALRRRLLPLATTFRRSNSCRSGIGSK